MHQTVTKSFLAQSYLSTTLLYAGLYTLVYKIESSSFQHLTGAKDPLSTPLIFFKMAVFSISTGTLCGTSSIIPDMWLAQLIASTQMLMSYVYFASVLYMAVHPPKNDLKWRVITRSNHHRSLHHVRTVWNVCWYVQGMLMDADVCWCILCRDRESCVEAQEYVLLRAMNRENKH